MIKNPEELAQADLEFDRTHPLTVEQKYRILEALYRLARMLAISIPMTQALTSMTSNSQGY